MTDILEKVSSVFTVVIGVMQSVLNTIVSEPLLFLPIILGLFGGICIFSIRAVRRLGVRAGSGGRRRRR